MGLRADQTPDKNIVTRPVPTTTQRRPPPATPTTPGFADDLFDRLWTIHDVAAFARVGERAAWRLMAHPDAPPRVRLGTRTIRRAPAAVVAFLLTGPGNHLEPAPAGRPDGTCPPVDPALVTVVPMRTSALAPSVTPSITPSRTQRPASRLRPSPGPARPGSRSLR